MFQNFEQTIMVNLIFDSIDLYLYGNFETELDTKVILQITFLPKCRSFFITHKIRKTLQWFRNISSKIWFEYFECITSLSRPNRKFYASRGKCRNWPKLFDFPEPQACVRFSFSFFLSRFLFCKSQIFISFRFANYSKPFGIHSQNICQKWARHLGNYGQHRDSTEVHSSGYGQG